MRTAEHESVLSPADMSSLLALEATGFPVRERWSAHSWQAELQTPSRRGFAVRDGRTVVAACLVSVLLGEAALLRGARRMLLEVREDNTAARRLYAATGFTQIHRRENYYGPDKDALVLARTLAPGVTEEEYA